MFAAGKRTAFWVLFFAISASVVNFSASLEEETCTSGTCLRKCCQEGESIRTENGRVTCGPESRTSLRKLADIEPFNIIHGNYCSDKSMDKVALNTSQKMFEFKLDENGNVIWNHLSFSYKNACVDAAEQGDGRLFGIICLEGEEEGMIISYIGMIISMPFLLATFIVYALLPDRNLHMKALMSYVINLMFSYLLLVINQLSQERIAPGTCTFLGYATLFFFMVSFFWMNVICFDIWFTFSGLRGHVNGRQAERRRFLIYCCYAWGMSILHVVVVCIIDQVSSQSAWYSPDIGVAQCFLQRGYPELFYFYGPMALLIASNVILFGITAFKIWSIKKDTAVLRKDENTKHSQENDKQTFILYLKLLFAMGVNWTMEVTSWAVNWGAENGSVSPVVWYLTDFCNAMYGVLIFFIFVFKKSIWKLLKRRYFSFMGRSHMAHSMSQNPTRTTNYSTTGTGLSMASEA